MKQHLTKNQIDIRKRILDISHAKHLSHLGSCLSAVDIILGIYAIKSKNERFVLSNGHAGVALYAVLEQKKLLSRKDTITFNIHPDRNVKKHIDVSTGSLGQGLPIAVGVALADPTKKVFCMVSDGECAEGSIWESLRIISDNAIYNLVILVNANGYSAYDEVQTNKLYRRIKAFGIHTKKIQKQDEKSINLALKTAKRTNKSSVLFFNTTVNQFSFLKGIDAHYHVMSDEEYRMATKQLGTFRRTL